MRKIIALTMILLVPTAYAGGYDCESSEKPDPVVTYKQDDATWVEDDGTDSPTLTQIVIKMPKMYKGAAFEGVSLRTSKRPRFIIPLRPVTGSFGFYESDEKSNKYFFTEIVADKSFFEGQNCILVQYKKEESLKFVMLPIQIEDASKNSERK